MTFSLFHPLHVEQLLSHDKCPINQALNNSKLMQFCLVNNSKQGRLHKESICFFLILGPFPSAEVFPLWTVMLYKAYVSNFSVCTHNHVWKVAAKTNHRCLIFSAECTFQQPALQIHSLEMFSFYWTLLKCALRLFLICWMATENIMSYYYCLSYYNIM